jgi:hypothetical protein
MPDHLDVTPVARMMLVGHDDAVMRLLFSAYAAQTNAYHTS